MILNVGSHTDLYDTRRDKRPKGDTWRKDWSDEELLKAERLGFYQKDSNVFTIDFDDQSFVAHKYINMLPDTFTDGKK